MQRAGSAGCNVTHCRSVFTRNQRTLTTPCGFYKKTQKREEPRYCVNDKNAHSLRYGSAPRLLVTVRNVFRYEPAKSLKFGKRFASATSPFFRPTRQSFSAVYFSRLRLYRFFVYFIAQYNTRVNKNAAFS